MSDHIVADEVYNYGESVLLNSLVRTYTCISAAMGSMASKKESGHNQFELGITDNQLSPAHSRLVAPYCEQWTELSPSIIAIQEKENTPYTCELQPDHHLASPSGEGETAACSIKEYTNSEPQSHCPASGSQGNQMLHGQGKGAGTAEGIYVWVLVYGLHATVL